MLTNEKHFPNTISQWEFHYGLFTNLLRIIVAYNFNPSSTSLEKMRILTQKVLAISN